MKIAIPLVLLTSIFIAACSTREYQQSGRSENTAAGSAEPISDSPAALEAKTASNTASAAKPVVAARRDLTVGQKVSLIKAEQIVGSEYGTDRKIIRNAELELEAESPETAQQSITSIAEINGGFVVESQQSSSDSRATVRDIVNMSVRVPAARFSDALDQIRRTGTRVVSETVKGQDVTEEFIDVEAQLRAKKALEMQFMEIMKRAVRVDEALNVQTELAEVRSEIERIEGRKRFLENQSGFSTIRLRIQTAKVTASRSQGFSERIVEAFSSGVDVAISFMAGLVMVLAAVLPFAVLIGLPGALIFRYFWLRQARLRTAAEIARDEVKIA